LGGFLAWIIPEFGWRSGFYVGGAIPLAIAAAMWMGLPESPAFGGVKASRGVPIVQLFAEGRARGTLGLWTVNFMNLLNLYFLSNWLPTLVRDAGYAAGLGVVGRDVATRRADGDAAVELVDHAYRVCGGIGEWVRVSAGDAMIGQPD
jgi:MFS family permease